MRPPGLHKARNAEQLLAYNADAFAAAEPKDIGALGDCECTHCGAQLWPAEATKVPPSARGYSCNVSRVRTVICCTYRALQSYAFRQQA